MATIRPEVTGRAVGEHLEPLAVSPLQACKLLSVGNTRLYALLAAGELESYLDGRMRRITLQSIRRRVARLVAAPGATGGAPQLRRRGRPRKNQAGAVAQ
jgi:excisionase family DNA binding protein